jgi:hypothetical protein
LIEVIDPAHPLFGHRFQLLWLCQAPHSPGFAEVRYRDHLRLRIPLSATNRAACSLALRRTKLTLDGIQQLLALAKECPDPCPNHLTASGPG